MSEKKHRPSKRQELLDFINVIIKDPDDRHWQNYHAKSFMKRVGIDYESMYNGVDVGEVDHYKLLLDYIPVLSQTEVYDIMSWIDEMYKQQVDEMSLATDDQF